MMFSYKHSYFSDVLTNEYHNRNSPHTGLYLANDASVPLRPASFETCSLLGFRNLSSFQPRYPSSSALPSSLLSYIYPLGDRILRPIWLHTQLLDPYVTSEDPHRASTTIFLHTQSLPLGRIGHVCRRRLAHFAVICKK